MEKLSEKKNPFLDFLKGVAILLVLFGHCLQYGSGTSFLESEAYWNNAVLKLIYSFHMPLFIAVSGYLFHFSVERNGMMQSVMKRIQTLLPVCLTWAVILCMKDFAMEVSFSFKSLVKYFLTDFWFLWSVVISACCTALFDTLFGKRGGGVRCLGYSVLLIVFLLTPDSFWFNAHKFMVPFFLGGYYYAKRKSKYLDNRYVGIAAIALWLLLMLNYSKDTYIYTTGISILGKDSMTYQMFVDLYRYLVGFAGVVAIVFLLKNLYRIILHRQNCVAAGVRKTIEYMGRDSLTFYILSTYLFVWVMPYLTQSFSLNYLIIIAETVIVSLMCFLVGSLIKRNSFLSRILIGKK